METYPGFLFRYYLYLTTNLCINEDIEMIIYKTTNLVNGKIYVGQSKYNNPNYLGSGTRLALAINKYGKENFKKEIIEECNTPDELNEREKYWIKELKSQDRNIGYNITSGGENSQYIENMTPLEREQLRQLKIKNQNKWHNSLSEAERLIQNKKISIGVRKFCNTPEYKKTQSDGSKRMWNKDGYRESFLPKWYKRMDEYWTTTKRVERSELVSSYYEDPEYYERWMKSMKVYHMKPNIRKGRSDRMKGKNNPGWKGYVYMIDNNGNEVAYFEDVKSMVNILYSIGLPKQTLHECLKLGEPYKANFCTRDTNEIKEIKKQFKGFSFEYRK